MKQILYQGPTVLEWLVNLTVIGRSLRSACEPIHVFLCGGEGGEDYNYTENVLSPTLQNLVDQVTICQGFMHTLLSPYLYFAYVDIPCGTESAATTENYCVCVCVCGGGGGPEGFLAFYGCFK